MGILLFVSEQEIRQDELNRTVTTLTQEIVTKLSLEEAEALKSYLRELDEEDYILYNRDYECEYVEITGEGVIKAIEFLNNLPKIQGRIKPVTELHKNKNYVLEIEF